MRDPSFEHDGCGVASVVHLSGVPSHETVRRALVALANMRHRGAEGADPTTGDGAGILLQVPDQLFRCEVDGLPPAGRYGVATCFLPRDAARRARVERLLGDCVRAEGQAVLGWRDVPVDNRHVGELARREAPVIRQLFVGSADGLDQDAFERKLYVVRRVVEKDGGADVVLPSFSSRTIVYKGMLAADQLVHFYPDLADNRTATALALVHSRFSTNTFPSWELAHPYRVLAHNGEVNTLIGNVNWMRARQSHLKSELFGRDMAKVLPVPDPEKSDSAILDNVLELLMLAGRSLPQAVMMLIPEAHEGRDDLPDELRDFFAFQSCLMEPWDGPAAVSFTDGRLIGSTLDRNGLRPGRWVITTDGWVVVSSEAGALPVDSSTVLRKGRLRPGKLFLVDIENGSVSADGEVELEIARRRPYGQWWRDAVVHLEDIPGAADPPPSREPLVTRQLAFGYSREDLEVVLRSMVEAAKEPTGSMGDDAALAVLSDRQPPLFRYFKQRFAQVTNPAIDPEREAIVMSLTFRLGPVGNLLEESAEHAQGVVLSQPVLVDAEMGKLRALARPRLASAVVDCTWPAVEGAAGLRSALDRVCGEAAGAVSDGAGIVILSDRGVGPDAVAIPSLLATAAVHHHLVREGCRLRAGLVVESGEPREVHHLACLIGYGAGAVNPYLMLETVRALAAQGDLDSEYGPEEAEARVIAALGKALRKVISKMGISTIQSYCGAQIFEAVGLDRALVDDYFTGTPSRIDGVGLDVLAAEAFARHRRAWPTPRAQLPDGGLYAWRREGEQHIWNPTTVTLLQDAVRNGGGREAFRSYSRAVEEATRKSTIRGLLKLETVGRRLPLEEVEPATEIVRHFATGAMSLGSISPEAHETLAVAMNRIGGKSNTGEGGEDPRRWVTDPNGDCRRSAIKQVASARFGVTTTYLVEADELQIKICQGSKPGEGGQLPGHKVSEDIARLRHSTPGVELISPPPHHDIYSIEDLKQLIYDLRCVNPTARVSVKLAAEVGVGTVAAGVAKAGADHVVIAGHDGGTGASPLSSISSAGVPWELGLAETQQVLVDNDLRSRITIQADGQMKTARDVVVAALLGAEEVGFSTAPLIATGCIMMRVCHLNTCPVGIATQDEELRKRFTGTPDHVVTFFFLLAEEVRAIMADLGIATFADMVGRTDLLRADPTVDHWKAHGIDLSSVLAGARTKEAVPRRCVRKPDPIVADAFDLDLMAAARPALEHGVNVRLQRGVGNMNRTVGGLLSGEIARAHGETGLAPGTIVLDLVGSAGQSLGAWLAPGVDITVRGEANDYVGKGMSGGVVVVRPPDAAPFPAEENVIAGNTILYGATGGRAFFRGLVGERFAVRNSGASAVVEGVGDHGCEYMTGGCVVVLGPTGRNFAAGMSGGVAYVLDHDGTFLSRCNTDLVDVEGIAPDDVDNLRSLVEEHERRTGSPVARAVLDEWGTTLPSFRKVMPRDYRRALAEQGQREAAGTADGDVPDEEAAVVDA